MNGCHGIKHAMIFQPLISTGKVLKTNVTLNNFKLKYFVNPIFRPVDHIRGFSRETVIEVTTNIESQEMRRHENGTIGYAEHPRAGGTDDLETFFGLTHRYVGNVFTLKQFKEFWPQIVR